MKTAVKKIRELKARYEKASVDDKSGVYNTDLVSMLEVGDMLDLSEITSMAALLRTESRGAHSRRDYPERDDVNWLKHSLAFRTPEGPRFEYIPVRITRWQPTVRRY